MKSFAIVGCGRIAHKHAENIKRIGRLVSVCDPAFEKAIALANKYQAKAYATIEDLLKDAEQVDVIVVCSPNGLHAEHVIKSLQARKHVLCEKPLCLTAAAAWQIVETEKFCRRHLYLVKSSRYNPIVRQLKKLIVDGSLGNIYSFQLACFWNRSHDYYQDWKGKLFPDGGSLYNQFSHYVDAIIWLFGELNVARGFQANKAHPQIEIEDTGVVALQMSNEVLRTLCWSVNAFQKNHEIGLTILAEKATIRIGGEYLQEVQYVSGSEDIPFSKDWSFESKQQDHHYELYNQLIKALESNDVEFANVYDGLKTVEAIEKIYKATAAA